MKEPPADGGERQLIGKKKEDGAAEHVMNR